jgi:hypothetical protein
MADRLKPFYMPNAFATNGNPYQQRHLNIASAFAPAFPPAFAPAFSPFGPHIVVASPSSHCRVHSCTESHRAHSCYRCGVENSDHFSRNCPNPHRCKARNCEQRHGHHQCRNCGDYDSAHCTSECPHAKPKHFCSNCGKSHTSSDKFCSGCGKRV